MNKAAGTYLALSVAAIFSSSCAKKNESGAVPSAEAPVMGAKPAAGEVQCLGIHECKGKSACHVAGGHACAGQNACKGKGWIHVPRAECESKGGKIIDS